MEIKPGKIHLRRQGRGIEPIEADKNAFAHLRVDLGRAALCPQLGQRLTPESFNHRAM
jgi:hypothetical protein